MNFALFGTGDSVPLPLCRNSAFLFRDMPGFSFGLFLRATLECWGGVAATGTLGSFFLDVVASI